VPLYAILVLMSERLWAMSWLISLRGIRRGGLAEVTTMRTICDYRELPEIGLSHNILSMISFRHCVKNAAASQMMNMNQAAMDRVTKKDHSNSNRIPRFGDVYFHLCIPLRCFFSFAVASDHVAI